MNPLWELHCAECGALIGYHSGNPVGYIICPDCNEKREQDGEHDKSS